MPKGLWTHGSPDMSQTQANIVAQQETSLINNIFKAKHSK